MIETKFYCADCGCPDAEHDLLGICHALDMPAMGIANDCKCGGYVQGDPYEGRP
jgi:hypothetical protein